jgi:hypothetical protein
MIAIALYTNPSFVVILELGLQLLIIELYFSAPQMLCLKSIG